MLHKSLGITYIKFAHGAIITQHETTTQMELDPNSLFDSHDEIKGSQLKPSAFTPSTKIRTIEGGVKNDGVSVIQRFLNFFRPNATTTTTSTASTDDILWNVELNEDDDKWIDEMAYHDIMQPRYSNAVPFNDPIGYQQNDSPYREEKQHTTQRRTGKTESHIIKANNDDYIYNTNSELWHDHTVGNDSDGYDHTYYYEKNGVPVSGSVRLRPVSVEGQDSVSPQQQLLSIGRASMPQQPMPAMPLRPTRPEMYEDDDEMYDERYTLQQPLSSRVMPVMPAMPLRPTRPEMYEDDDDDEMYTLQQPLSSRVMPVMPAMPLRPTRPEMYEDDDEDEMYTLQQPLSSRVMPAMPLRPTSEMYEDEDDDEMYDERYTLQQPLSSRGRPQQPMPAMPLRYLSPEMYEDNDDDGMYYMPAMPLRSLSPEMYEDNDDDGMYYMPAMTLRGAGNYPSQQRIPAMPEVYDVEGDKYEPYDNWRNTSHQPQSAAMSGYTVGTEGYDDYDYDDLSLMDDEARWNYNDFGRREEEERAYRDDYANNDREFGDDEDRLYDTSYTSHQPQGFNPMDLLYGVSPMDVPRKNRSRFSLQEASGF